MVRQSKKISKKKTRKDGGAVSEENQQFRTRWIRELKNKGLIK